MAKKVESNKVKTISTPTPHGSHRSMVVADSGDGFVKCQDELGEYVTLAGRLDNGLADPNRFSRK